MAWLYLVIAGLFEIVWAIGLKYTEGFTRLWPSVWTLSGMIASIGFLAQALKTIPLGTGYVVWTGIGAVGTLTMGVLLFGEALNPMKIAGIVLVMIGIVALKLAPA